MNVVTLIAAAFSLFSNSTPLTDPRMPLTGDYVEARTASVFAGACHVCGLHRQSEREQRGKAAEQRGAARPVREKCHGNEPSA